MDFLTCYSCSCYNSMIWYRRKVLWFFRLKPYRLINNLTISITCLWESICLKYYPELDDIFPESAKWIKKDKKSLEEFFKYCCGFLVKSFLEHFAYNIFKNSNETLSTKEKDREKVFD